MRTLILLMLALFIAEARAGTARELELARLSTDAKEAMFLLVELGVLTGEPGGPLHPNSFLKRYDASDLLARFFMCSGFAPADRSNDAESRRRELRFLINDLTPMPQVKKFVDVGFLRPDPTVMAEKGFFSGRANGRFEGTAWMTREEFVACLMRGFVRSNVHAPIDYSRARFADVSDGSWALGPIMAAAATGLIQGEPGRLFRPKAPIRRWEAAVIVVRATRTFKS